MQDNKDTADISGLLIKLATKLFRMLLWLIAITASIGAVAYLYSAYEEHKELTYMTSDKCSEHDYQTQICETEDGSLYLRRIEMANNRMSVSMLIDDAAWDDYKYSYWAFWFESCEEGLELETNKVDSSGTVFKLSCNTQANYFFTNRPPSRLEIGLTTAVKSGIKLDSDGFTIDHDYSSTDYSSLQRRLVLTNGQTREDRKARKLKEAEMEEARRIKKEAAAEQARQKRLALQKNKRECEGRNKQAKQTFDSTVAQAGKTMLDTKQVSFLCKKYRPRSFDTNVCSRYAIQVSNSTDLPIISARIGYGTKKSCKKTELLNTLGISARIAPKGSLPHISSIEWPVYGGNLECARLLDVEFDTTFKPEQC